MENSIWRRDPPLSDISSNNTSSELVIGFPKQDLAWESQGYFPEGWRRNQCRMKHYYNWYSESENMLKSLTKDWAASKSPKINTLGQIFNIFGDIAPDLMSILRPTSETNSYHYASFVSSFLVKIDGIEVQLPPNLSENLLGESKSSFHLTGGLQLSIKNRNLEVCCLNDYEYTRTDMSVGQSLNLNLKNISIFYNNHDETQNPDYWYRHILKSFSMKICAEKIFPLASKLFLRAQNIMNVSAPLRLGQQAIWNPILRLSIHLEPIIMNLSTADLRNVFALKNWMGSENIKSQEDYSLDNDEETTVYSKMMGNLGEPLLYRISQEQALTPAVLTTLYPRTGHLRIKDLDSVDNIGTEALVTRSHGGSETLGTTAHGPSQKTLIECAVEDFEFQIQFFAQPLGSDTASHNLFRATTQFKNLMLFPEILSNPAKSMLIRQTGSGRIRFDAR